jgi:hypothetical protein
MQYVPETGRQTILPRLSLLLSMLVSCSQNFWASFQDTLSTGNRLVSRPCTPRPPRQWALRAHGLARVRLGLLDA